MKKQFIRNVAMQAARIKDPTKMEAFLKELYTQAFADGANAEVEEDGYRFVRIQIGRIYECQCPECGAFMELDLLGLLDEKEGESDDSGKGHQGSAEAEG